MTSVFITLTNNGYIDYTLNCLKSLENIQCKVPLHCHCIGSEGYTILKDNGYECTLIDDEKHTNFEEYAHGKFAFVVYYKLLIIYENLLKYDYVCYTDGDIVFENNNFFNYLLDSIGNNDLLIQNDRFSDKDNTSSCSGFMFIRSNPKTRDLLNPKHILKYLNIPAWHDQIYINEILYRKYNILNIKYGNNIPQNKLKFKSLPLNLFPNGSYYNTNHEKLTPYMIHFNYIVGKQKQEYMKKFNKWLLTTE